MQKVMRNILNTIFVFIIIGDSLSMYFHFVENKPIIKDIIAICIFVFLVIFINIISLDKKDGQGKNAQASNH